jgi:hypothetical protein
VLYFIDLEQAQHRFKTEHPLPSPKCIFRKLQPFTIFGARQRIISDNGDVKCVGNVFIEIYLTVDDMSDVSDAVPAGEDEL